MAITLKKQRKALMRCTECTYYKVEPENEYKRPPCPKAKADPDEPDAYVWPLPSGAMCDAFKPAAAGVVGVYRGFSISRNIPVQKTGRRARGSYTAVAQGSLPTVFTGRNMAEITSQIDFYLYRTTLDKAA